MAEIVRVREDRLGRAHTGEVIAPMSRSGGPFHYELRHRGWRFYADSPHPLLAVLIDGYPALPAGPAAVDPEQLHLLEDENSDGLGDRRLQARVRHAAATRTRLAVQELVDAEQRGGPLAPDVREVLAAPTIPPPLVGAWTHSAPLFLLDVAYRPYTDRPCPSGNIVWLRPASAEGYLLSLAAAGAIALAVRP